MRMRRRDLVQIAAALAWLTLWLVLTVADVSLADSEVDVAVVASGLALGLVLGRWWSAAVPFAFALLAPLFANDCLDCYDDPGAGVLALALVSMPSAACAGAGVALRRGADALAARRFRPPLTLIWVLVAGVLVAWAIWMISA
jgi:hypothetical protein